MIFRPELARLILAGKKTQTRRIIKPDEDECRYQPGRTYAVQPGRGKEEIGRIAVTAVRDELLDSITFEDAREEGFRTRAEFARYWLHLHDSAWLDRFPDEDPATDAQVLDRFTSRHGHKRVWVLTFQIYDRLWLLAPAARPAGSTHGYTENELLSLADEPEGIDPEIVERLPASLEARQRYELERAEREATYAGLPVLERARIAIESAREAGVETRRAEARIRTAVETLEAKTRKQAA